METMYLLQARKSHLQSATLLGTRSSGNTCSWSLTAWSISSPTRLGSRSYGNEITHEGIRLGYFSLQLAWRFDHLETG